MKVKEAKDLVLTQMQRDLASSGAAVLLDPNSPDPKDPGKFMLGGMPARVIHRFSGWHVPIRLDWFDDLYSFPRINRSEFYWYVFAVPAYGGFKAPHYFVCDFYQMRSWVLEFAAPKGIDHQDHHDWLAFLHPLRRDPREARGYFRWGDEVQGVSLFSSRVVHLDNVADLALRERFVGTTHTPTGESEAHRLLKQFVADNPLRVGLSPDARATLEYRFSTGDRVDVLFENHGPLRAAVEVELEGDHELCVGIHQALKYRTLAASERGYPLVGEDVRGVVAAFDVDYPVATALARRYRIPLIGIPREEVLAPA